MNDIIDDIESDILIFADDTSLFATGSDPAETVEFLNRDSEKISIWATKWKITFNAKKTKDKLGLSCAKLRLASAKLPSSLSSDQLKLATI